jgi:hypothetical protein
MYFLPVKLDKTTGSEKRKVQPPQLHPKPKTKIYESEIFSTKYKPSKLSGVKNEMVYINTLQIYIDTLHTSS